MDVHGRVPKSAATQSEEEMELRRGPWTVEEDLILMNYIANHGEGRWNSLARCAGLKRTGKSCRLRWLNYLRPDVRRGNITPEEQLLILELHSRWGNRWSKIAQHLPGRTDNEIKNYWRTRVQKHARQLQCDVNSKKFRDAMRYLWMPRLVERIRAAQAAAAAHQLPAGCPPGAGQLLPPKQLGAAESFNTAAVSTSADSVSSTGLSSPPASDVDGGCCFANDGFVADQQVGAAAGGGGWPESLPSPGGYVHPGWPEFEQAQGAGWGGDMGENWWNVSDIWSMQQ